MDSRTQDKNKAVSWGIENRISVDGPHALLLLKGGATRSNIHIILFFYDGKCGVHNGDGMGY